MAYDGKKAFWLSVGIFSGIGATVCLSELRKYIRKQSTRKPLSEIQDEIDLDDLAALARSPNISLKRSAEQLILDRAMKDKNLEYIVNACYSSDEVQVLKGITVVGVLVKSSEFRSKLIEFNVLETLAHCLDYSIAPGYKELMNTGGKHIKVQRVITSALFELICDDDSLKLRLGKATPKIVSSILQLMFVCRSKEVVRWCLFLAHQMSLCDALRPKLVDSDVISKVSQVLVRNQGDYVLMRLCLQTLVMCANMNEEGEIQALHEMARHKVIQPTVTCLKADDSDLVYWATALIHEYSVKDLYRAQICAVPNIIKILQGVLSTSEAILQRIVLRVISFLCLGEQEFRKKVLDSNSIMMKLTVCFASGDNDVVHWAIVLLHDLLLSSGSCGSSSKDLAERVVSVCDNIIKSLVSLAGRKDNNLIRVLAEVIGFFCSVDFPSDILQKHIINDGALEAVLIFLQSTDTELQLWASALLLNLCMTSDLVKQEIIRLGGMKPLIELAISENDQAVAAQSAKTLVMLGFVDHRVSITLEAPSPNHDQPSRITFDGKDYSFFNKSGINLCVFDFLTFKITDVLSYDTGHDKDAVDQLIKGIEAIPCGCLVFMVCTEASTYMTAFESVAEVLKEVGIIKFVFKSGERWAYVGQKKKPVGEQIAIHRSYDNVSLQAGIPLDHYVNDLVLTNLLLPVIDLMMSTPATSGISKVCELELLTIMARHDYHKQVMVFQKGLLKYLADLCWNITSNSMEYLREHPMFIAHCIGALKIINSISVSECFHEELLCSSVLRATITLLHFTNDVTLMKANLTVEQLSPLMSPKRGTESESDIPDAQSSKHPRSNVPVFPLSHTDPLLTTACPEEISFDERKSAPTCQSESSSAPEDFDDAFCTIVRLAVTTIYNCMELFADFNESRDSLLQSGTLQTLWCTLLISNEATLAQVGLPIEALLNCFACMGISEKGVLEDVIELDDRIKTAALMLSADHFEAFNLNWTFESIRSTAYVGRKKFEDSDHPDGWYYEVTLRSSGILQIGWQTEDCPYGPEKGVGVGDNLSSCAFDGARCKVWNGPAAEHRDNDYGTEWHEGDVLSCLFSWEGNVSFWLNGVDQGVAFHNMNVNLNWYPAASLAMDQHCMFNFGRKPFRYSMPERYVTVSAVYKYQNKDSTPTASCWSLTQHFDDLTVDVTVKDLLLTLTPEITEHGSSQSTEEKQPIESDDELLPSEEKQCINDPQLSPDSPSKDLPGTPLDSPSKDLPGTPLDSPSKDLPGTPLDSPSKDLPGTPLDSPSKDLHGTPLDRPSKDLPGTPLDSPSKDLPDIPLDNAPQTPLETISVFNTSTPEATVQPRHSRSPCVIDPTSPLSAANFEDENVVDSGAKAAWLQFSPGESLSVECDTPSFPCFYFEAELKNTPSSTKQMGFFCTKTGRKIYCDLVDNQLYLPKTSHHTPSKQECYRSPDVVGCGILWPAGIVFFTLDGVGTGQYYQFPTGANLQLNDLFPYISCSRICCNYGQRAFLFEGANFKEVSFAGANLLHAHSLNIEITSHGTSK